MNYTETEAKVREATNEDPWGPSGTQMSDLAKLTFMYEHFAEICGNGTGMLWKRMFEGTFAHFFEALFEFFEAFHKNCLCTQRNFLIFSEGEKWGLL